MSWPEPVADRHRPAHLRPYAALATAPVAPRPTLAQRLLAGEHPSTDHASSHRPPNSTRLRPKTA